VEPLPKQQPEGCPRCGAAGARSEGIGFRVYAAGLEVRRSSKWHCDQCHHRFSLPEPTR
jgi:transcriptional regulator NrdR family protein